MARHTIDQFGGLNYRSGPRDGADRYASEAVNVKLWRGNLEPFRQPKEVLTHDECIAYARFFGCALYTSYNPCASFARDALCGLTYGTDVDDFEYPVVSANLNADSVQVVDPVWVRLGVPSPSPLTFDAPALSTPLGTPTDGFQIKREHRDYVYTYVNQFGQEGEPSDPSPSAKDADADAVVTVNVPAPPVGRGIVSIRLYRVQTGNMDGAFGEANNGVYLFVDEIEVTEGQPLTYTDRTPVDCLQEPVSTWCWHEPPEDLSGIIELEQGGLAGFEGKNLWFSERFNGHAWPCSVNLDDCIRSIHEVSGSIYVVTDGHPYVVSSQSDAEDCKCCRSVTKMSKSAPLISDHRGVAVTPTGVIWPTREGMMRMSGAAMTLITHSHIPEDDWLKYYPSTLKSTTLAGRLYSFGAAKGFTFDYSDGVYSDGDVGADSRLVDLSYAPDFVFTSDENQMYMVFKDKLMLWDESPDYGVYKWVSKVIHSPLPISWSVVQVGTVRCGKHLKVFIEDGCGDVLDCVDICDGGFERLKAGIKERSIRIRVHSDVAIDYITVATGIGDLQ